MDRVKPPGNGRNIAGCYMVRPFAHPVSCCCMLLGVVAESLKPVKLLATCKRTQQLPTMLRPFARGLSRKSGENSSHTACQTWHMKILIDVINVWAFHLIFIFIYNWGRRNQSQFILLFKENCAVITLFNTRQINVRARLKISFSFSFNFYFYLQLRSSEPISVYFII